jgi:hypothetical protein
LGVSGSLWADVHYAAILKDAKISPGVPVVEYNREETHHCSVCGGEFQTRCKIKRRCDACQAIAVERQVKRATEKLKARRRARREAKRGK